MATGEVQLVGTLIESGHYDPDNTKENTIDGDFQTSWASNGGNSGWVGNDAGVAVVPTRFRFASAPDNYTRACGIEFRGANVSNFAGATVFGTIDPNIVYPRFQFYELPISGGGSFRYLSTDQVIANSAYGGNFSEIRWIIQAGSAATARPVAPVISPWGGHFVAGACSIAITSLTTSASIYYTLDGSTPTNASTLYTGPLNFTCTSGQVLNAIAYDASLSTPSSEMSSSVLQNYGFKASDDIYDNRGVLLNAFGGNVMLNNGTYYLIGAPTNRFDAAIGGIQGVYLYKSTDLYLWTFVGQILGNGGYNFVERPKLIRIDATHFVMWAHGSNDHSAADRCIIASASAPEGPWTYTNTSYDPDGDGFKDSNVFTDTDGTNYVTYTGLTAFHISRMASDGLSCDGATVVVTMPLAREAPILFKRLGVYFLITSAPNYYDSNFSFDERYIVSTAPTPLSGWPDWDTTNLTVYAVEPAPGPFNGQSMWVLPAPAGGNQFIYIADHWNHDQLYDSRAVWLPLTFPTTTTLLAQVPTTWDLNQFGMPRTGLMF